MTDDLEDVHPQPIITPGYMSLDEANELVMATLGDLQLSEFVHPSWTIKN